MAPHWDEDSAQLRRNLREAQRDAAEAAVARRPLTLDTIKGWHRRIMQGLDIPNAANLKVAPADLIGEFRGPPKLPGIGARIGDRLGIASDQVGQQCREFIGTLQQLLDRFDQMLPGEPRDRLNRDARRGVAEAAAWAHCEWVRIHPFANGNGRTARLLGNAILVRYGLPPVFRLRPRPEGSYAYAATAAMDSNYLPMADYVLDQLDRWRP